MLFVKFLQKHGSLRDLASELFSCSTADLASEYLTAELQRVFHICTPPTHVRTGPWRQIPLPAETRNFIREKNRLFRHRDSWSLSDRRAFRKLHAKCRFLVQKAKSDWAQSVLEETDDRSGASFWKAIRRITGNRLGEVPTLVDGDSIAVSDARKADLLAAELNKNYNSEIRTMPDFSMTSCGPSIPLQLDDLVVEMRQILRKLRKTSPGSDGIPPAFLKGLAEPLAPAFAALAYMCATTESFPANLKIARIRPIPKVPGTLDPAEFRPISILSGSSKVLESWMLTRLQPFLEPSASQFGFRRHYSTEDALLMVEHLVSEGLRSCPTAARVLLVLFDLRRAFDSCIHSDLLHALIDRGVPSDLLQIVFSYLSSRQQFVQIGDSRSKTTSIPSGVAQGSLLGPYLFNVLVDKIFELAHLSTSGNLVLYADDTAYLKPLPSQLSESEAQNDILVINAAFQQLGLTINPAKSKYLIISPTGTAEIPLSISGHHLEKVTSAKYLGFLLDSQFSFCLHAQSKALSLKRAIGALHRTVGAHLPRCVYRQLYLQKLLPQLTYGLAVCAPRFKYSWRQLESVHRFALRSILNDYQASYESLLESAAVPPIAAIWVQRAAGLIYRHFYGLRQLPVPFIVKASQQQQRRMSARNLQTHTLLLPTEIDLLPVRRNREISITMPNYKVVKLWNLLAADGISFGLNRFSANLANYHSSDTEQTLLLKTLTLICELYPSLAAYSTL